MFQQRNCLAIAPIFCRNHAFVESVGNSDLVFWIRSLKRVGRLVRGIRRGVSESGKIFLLFGSQRSRSRLLFITAGLVTKVVQLRLQSIGDGGRRNSEVVFRALVL